MPEPAKMEEKRPARKGENPFGPLEKLLITLLTTMLTTVIHKLFTYLSTSSTLGKLFGGKD